jgi:hypothetical protein
MPNCLKNEGKNRADVEFFTKSEDLGGKTNKCIPVALVGAPNFWTGCVSFVDSI